MAQPQFVDADPSGGRAGPVLVATAPAEGEATEWTGTPPVLVVLPGQAVPPAARTGPEPALVTWAYRAVIALVVLVALAALITPLPSLA